MQYNKTSLTTQYFVILAHAGIHCEIDSHLRGNDGFLAFLDIKNSHERHQLLRKS
jgi:hypothetical protein